MNQSLLFRSTILLAFVFLIISGMVYAQGFLIPVFFAGLLSLLLLPLSNIIESKIHHRVAAIILTIVVFIIIICGISYFISTQISYIISDSEMIQARLTVQMHKLQIVISEYTGINETDQLAWFNKQSEQWIKSGFTKVQDVLLTFGNFVFGLTLVIIYIFFLLLYRSRIKLFILSLTNESNHETILSIINKVKQLVLQYLTGLFIALSILGAMNAIGLKILGIEHGIFLGFLAGFLNIIPYIGSFIGGALPVIMALIYKDNIWYAVGVLAIFMFNQFIDNNITTPRVVGGYVRINSLATIIAVIIGGMIWGVGGMILFIPLLGIFKIFCDNIETLHPLSILLSEDEEAGDSFIKKFTDWFKKKKITS